MNYTVRIAPEAESEFLQAKKWYEEQQTGLGEKFSKNIKEHINGLKDPSVEHKLVAENVRRILTKPFPFVIYYMRDEKNMVIKIIAILHNRREPLKFD